MTEPQGPQDIVCTRDGHSCWYANNAGSGQVCEVTMNKHTRHHHTVVPSLVQPIDVETGDLIDLPNTTAVALYYPNDDDKSPCLRAQLCPTPGVPVLLLAYHYDDRRTRIAAMDTATGRAIVLVKYRAPSHPDEDACHDEMMLIERMTVAYDPHPVIFVSSGHSQRLDRVSLVTGQPQTIRPATCEYDGDGNKLQAQQHGMVALRQHLYMARGTEGIGRLQVVDTETNKYLHTAAQSLLPHVPISASGGYDKNNWMDVLYLSSNPSHLLLLEDDEMYSYSLANVQDVHPVVGEGNYEGARAFASFKDDSDAVVVAARDRLVVLDLISTTETAEQQTTLTSKVARVLSLPDACSVPQPTIGNHQERPGLVLSLMAVLAINVLAAFVLWRRRKRAVNRRQTTTEMDREERELV